MLTKARLHRSLWHRARRILRGTVRGTSKRILPTYRSAELGELPSWLASVAEADDWGAVLGVFDPNGGPAGAVVVAENGICVFQAGAPSLWLPYRDVRGFEVLSKEPPAPCLPVKVSNGEVVNLPFEGGHAFAFIQFLGYAADQWARLLAAEESSP